MGPNGGEQFWGKVRSTPKLWTAVWFPWSAWLAISTLRSKSCSQTYQRCKRDMKYAKATLQEKPIGMLPSYYLLVKATP